MKQSVVHIISRIRLNESLFQELHDDDSFALAFVSFHKNVYAVLVCIILLVIQRANSNVSVLCICAYRAMHLKMSILRKKYYSIKIAWICLIDQWSFKKNWQTNQFFTFSFCKLKKSLDQFEQNMCINVTLAIAYTAIHAHIWVREWVIIFMYAEWAVKWKDKRMIENKQWRKEQTENTLIYNWSENEWVDSPDRSNTKKDEK